jgi:NADP-reducing hydrogenase subunit HndB
MTFMKSLEELLAIKEKAQAQLVARDADGNDGIRVVVGMATCGIAAGARPVLKALVDEVAKRNVQHVSVTQTGCIGMCQYEPIVEIFEPGKEKVTYVQMTAEKAQKVVAEHLVNGKPVVEYTVGAVTK